MIKSMTGYGRAVETVNGREFTVELRSVNNRYLDCSVRMPRILSFGEEAVKQAVNVPVILTGGVWSAANADKLLTEGAADLIGVGRAMLKNPRWAEEQMK